MADHEDYLSGEAPMAHAASHESLGSDEIDVDGLRGVLADNQFCIPHDLGGAKHVADSLADLNTKVSDATLEDKTVLENTMDAKVATHAALPTVHQDAPALILTHKGDAAAHHAKYTDENARDAVLAILGDNVRGRKLRSSFIKLEDGTNANTVKIVMVSYWNGDAIASTDNIALNATTGHYSLNAFGDRLTIEASGLTGNCIAVPVAKTMYNFTGKIICIDHDGSGNDIVMFFAEDAVGGALSIPTLVDTGLFYVTITYLTDS